MTLPSRVQKVLDDWHINYSVSQASPSMSNEPSSDSLSNNLTQLAILEDELGQVQVIYPAHRILDLNKMQAQTTRSFTAMDHAKVEKIRQGLNLEAIPALPQVTGFETFVDASLLQQDDIVMLLGKEHELHIGKTDFQTLIGNARIGEYCVDIPSTQIPGAQWAQKDQQEIHHAIKNFTELRIHQRLEETLDMPPMPETAQRIIDLRMDEDAETEELAILVERDPGLSAQVISWANSPYYGVSGSITNIQEAVIRVLGFDLVINLALGLSLGRTLSVPKAGPRGYLPYWQQSVYCAALMAELCKTLPRENRPSQGLAYLSGLLHNFGYLILGHVFPPHFLMVNRHIDANPNVNRYFIEQHLLDITREQISSSLLKQWHLPEDVCRAIRYQNEPNYIGEDHILSGLLFVTSRLLRQQQMNDSPLEAIPQSIIHRLGLDMTMAQEALERVMDAKDDLQEMARQLDQG
ncbi:HDOD domain-containing protein [Oceaniserpentilla sp. 4NH20-0058]|uniref:aminoacyl-tRNA deacylase and HDOD domain-containing protein n=1 Tax=Oceaniserpentilla sp. 4NH20-0058 TaxID=3127660 RepID=UPI003105462B